MEKKKKAALYTRVSTVYQVDKDSLPHQKHALVEYVKYVLHIDDYEIFEDAGFSGKDTKRPAFQDMMTRIRAGEFTHLVVNKIDRISRNLLDFAAMYEELKKRNVIFVSCNEQFDTSNAMGEAMLKIILVFAELERHMTSERVTAVLLDRAKKGKWNGAKTPLGYRWTEGLDYPELYEPEARIVRFIFSQYLLDGMSTVKLARYLNEHHIPTKMGGEWRNTTVSLILQNPIYKGTLRYNLHDSANQRKIRPKKDWVIVENKFPPLVSTQAWESAQKKMNENRTNKHQQTGKHIHIFSGIMYCLCGARETSRTDKARRKSGYAPSAYSCPKHYGSMVKCDNNRQLSDIMIGTFVFTYIQNMLFIQKNIQSYLNQKDMEQKLLDGKPFANIRSIESESMKDIYRSFMQQANIDYQPKERAEVIVDDNMAMKEQLLKEKEAHQRALNRLNRVYLYSDNTFSEESFLAERKKIMDSLSLVGEKLKTFSEDSAEEETCVDFLKEASDYVLRKKLLSGEKVIWSDFALHVDEKILRHFFLMVVRRIVSYKSNIISIEFKNGVIHRFIYRA